ncbi:hypothetical protein EDB86DRAFT_2970602 [Lactarius hatsudake]|nr:hypothetical protein EDB86DRAFT_2970602 [Lactarius hatsudake]
MGRNKCGSDNGTRKDVPRGLRSPALSLFPLPSADYSVPVGRRATSSNATMQGDITLSVMVSTHPSLTFLCRSACSCSPSIRVQPLLCHAMVGNHMCSSHRIHGMLTSRKVIISNRKPTTLRETQDPLKIRRTPWTRHQQGGTHVLDCSFRFKFMCCIVASRHHPVAGPRPRLNRDGRVGTPPLLGAFRVYFTTTTDTGPPSYTYGIVRWRPVSLFHFKPLKPPAR